MYKTGVITDEITQDLISAVNLLKQYQLDAMEIRSVDEKNPFQMGRRDVDYIARVSREYGLPICAVSSPLFKCNLDNEKEIKENLEGFRRVLEAMHTWECRLVRGFTFWNRNKGSEDIPLVLERYQPVIELARDAGVTVVVESEPSVTVCSGIMLAGFLEALDSPQIKALWDPGNDINGRDYIPPYPNAYERLKTHIAHVHLKDMKATENGYDPVLLSEGDVDCEGVLSRLVADHYSGYIVLETHYRMSGRMNEDAMTKPQGSAFSAGGYEATVACLDILQSRFGWGGKRE